MVTPAWNGIQLMDSMIEGVYAHSEPLTSLVAGVKAKLALVDTGEDGAEDGHDYVYASSNPVQL